jgi:hypothetical protein
MGKNQNNMETNKLKSCIHCIILVSHYNFYERRSNEPFYDKFVTLLKCFCHHVKMPFYYHYLYSIITIINII